MCLSFAEPGAYQADKAGSISSWLILSMDKSTVLGFSDTSGDYKGLVSKYRTPYTWETLPRLSMVVGRVVIAYLGLQ